MKINSVNSINNTKNADKNNQQNPNFKGLLDVPGYVMNGIEKGGFATSFIIQDTLGMTVPRTGEGLQRGIDKDRVHSTWNVIKARLTFREPSEEDKQKCLSLKELNFKEGLEVGIREGLSGPVMMFTPMAVLLLGKKFAGKSSFTNSSMIKRLANKFTETLDKSTSGDIHTVANVKNEFYRNTVKNIVQSTTKPEIDSADSLFIEKAVRGLERLDRYDEKVSKSSGRMRKLYKKAREKANKQLIQDFNDYHKTNSTDLDMLNRVRLEGAVFNTDKTIDGIRGFAHDALHGKKAQDLFNNAEKLEEQQNYANGLKSKFIAKRQVVNALAAASTIGSLSIVPALYKLVNPVPPGALGDPTKAEGLNNKTTEPAANTASTDHIEQQKGSQVSFTGKLDTLARHFEFNGTQFTPALMTSLAVGGLMAPRVITAAKRAPEDPVTKKKDYSEIPEALTRDIVSTAAVTFGVPMLAKSLISTYENATGFVLQNRPKTPLSTTKKVLDKLNPFSSISYYGINDLDQIYGNVDTPDKLNNLSNFIDRNGGSLAKIFKTEKKTKSVFEKFGLDIKSLAKQSDRKAANSTIMDKMAEGNGFAQELIEALKPEKKGAANAMLKRARSLNSYVSFASTVFFVPVFLGLVLPKVVYAMTARRQKKAAEARALFEQQMNANSANNNQDTQTKIDYSTLRNAATSTTFTQLKHS